MSRPYEKREGGCPLEGDDYRYQDCAHCEHRCVSTDDEDIDDCDYECSNEAIRIERLQAEVARLTRELDEAQAAVAARAIRRDDARAEVMARSATLSRWADAIVERDEDGRLTPLAMALDAIRDHGCDCGEDEPGTCLACLCEAALRDLWEQRAAGAAMLARQADMARETEMDRDHLAQYFARLSIVVDEVDTISESSMRRLEYLTERVYEILADVNGVIDLPGVERLVEMRTPRPGNKP
jgi:hypothetical protein